MTIASPMTLTFSQGHKYVSNLTTFYLAISYHIQTWHDGRRMDAIYALARFNYLDLDARSQWDFKGQTNISVECSQQLSKQQALHLLTKVALFFCLLDPD